MLGALNSRLIVVCTGLASAEKKENSEDT